MKAWDRCLLIIALILLASACFGQDVGSPKFVLYGGAGGTNQLQAVHATAHFGADFEETLPYPAAHFPLGFLLEFGYASPRSDASGAGLFSANYVAPFVLGGRSAVSASSSIPNSWFLTGGYTALFGAGNAVNYGGGVDLVFKRTRAVRFEVRDYMLLSAPKEHNVALRVGIVLYLSD